MKRKEKLSDKITRNENATHQLGREIAERLLPGDILAIAGPLGAGKTTLIRGICAGLGVADVSSPTFTIVNCYNIPVPAFGEDKVEDFINEYSYRPIKKDMITVNHIDLYRITNENEFIQRGISDYLGEKDSITVVEWADHFPEYFQATGVIWIKMEIVDEGRRITLYRNN